MKTTNNILRVFALCLVTMLVNITAVAQNKLYVEDFSVVPGDTITVDVVLENTDNISSLQFDLNLPTGLAVDGYSHSTGRMTQDSHTLNCRNLQIDSKPVTRFVIFANAIEPEDTPVKGNSGALFSIQFRAAETFVGGKISITNVVASDATEIPAVEKKVTVEDAKVLANAGTFSFSKNEMTVGLNKKDTLHFFLNSTVAAVGLEARLQIPESLGAKVEKSKALAVNTTVVYSQKTSKLLISSLTNDNLPSGENPVFSIIMTPTAVGNSQIILSDVLISNIKTSFAVEGNGIVDVEVIDINATIYPQLKAQLDEIQQKFDDALAVINAYTSEEGKAVATSELATTIAKNLADETSRLEDAFNAGSVDETYVFTIAPEVYVADIEKLAADGIVAETNGVAFARLTAQIAEAQSALDAAKAEVAEKCADVSAEFDEAFAGVQAAIDALTADVKDKHSKVELTAESTVDTASVVASIEKVKADAASAQAAFEVDEAKKAANDAAFTALTAQIAEVQAALDAAKAEVAEKCADVSAEFDEAFAGVQAAIDALTADVKAKHEKVELTAESTVDTASVVASIDKVKVDAAAAQAAFEADEAKKAANDAAFTALTAQIAEAQSALDAAKAEVAEKCADVAAEFDEAFAGVQAAIDALTADVKAKHEKVELTAESTVDTASVVASIEKVKADAASAQAAFEAKKVANEEAFERLNKEIENLQNVLDAAKIQIASECKDVIALYIMTMNGIQEDINDMEDEVEDMYENMELTAESTVDTASILANIEKMLEDAKKAQEEYEIAMGIESVEGVGSDVVAVYTLDGKKVTSVVKGKVYIFQYADGKRQKKVLK